MDPRPSASASAPWRRRRRRQLTFPFLFFAHAARCWAFSTHTYIRDPAKEFSKLCPKKAIHIPLLVWCQTLLKNFNYTQRNSKRPSHKTCSSWCGLCFAKSVAKFVRILANISRVKSKCVGGSVQKLNIKETNICKLILATSWFAKLERFTVCEIANDA